MKKDEINLEEEENRHDMPMCPMCQMCPCMQQNANMMQGMYMNSSMKMGNKNPMMGQMAYPNGRDEDDEFDEDDSRKGYNHYYKHGYYPYMYNPYFYGGYGHGYGHGYGYGHHGHRDGETQD